MNIKEILTQLASETINTWFDLGLFLDRVKENSTVPSREFSGFYDDFRQTVIQGGLAFITFDYGVDGVTMEIAKYAACFAKILKGVPIHLIGGEFHPSCHSILSPQFRRFEIPQIRPFNKWPLYRDFFLTKLYRGSERYNSLIGDFWTETRRIVETLGSYLEEHSIALLYLVNVCSNPGNVSLALAVVLLAEFMGLPVINNNHDFYWEGGSRKVDILQKKAKPGPRDFFFLNSDIGEFFSLIEVLYPWESRSWIAVNINRHQSLRLIEQKGQNIANVTQIGTAIDINRYRLVAKRSMVKALYQIKDILAGYKTRLITARPDSFASRSDLRPLLIGYRPDQEFEFVHNNIIFLQPTRIMVRKKIETGFLLIKKLCEQEIFLKEFGINPFLNLTLLVTGPLAQGQLKYLNTLLEKFYRVLEELPNHIRGRIFLGFLCSEFDTDSFYARYQKPLSIPEIYSTASLILLPSETEGRGLPILEAAASGIPMLTNKYHPRHVYNEVTGKRLGAENRLTLLEVEDDIILPQVVRKVADWIFFPQRCTHIKDHNLRVVQKRFSQETLIKDMQGIFLRLYNQLKPNQFSMKRLAAVMQDYQRENSAVQAGAELLMDSSRRRYLPGYGQLKFMLYLKSLIDPSYFRVEEQAWRGMAMKSARNFVSSLSAEEKLNTVARMQFYNAVDNIFRLRSGEENIRYDHSFSYRHRNKNYYPYQDFTFQELLGLINYLFVKIFAPRPGKRFQESPDFFNDIVLALFQLTNSRNLTIDDRTRLIKKLATKLPMALFVGTFLKNELELFCVRHFRMLAGLNDNDVLSAQNLDPKLHKPVYLFASALPYPGRVSYTFLKEFIRESPDSELKLLYEYGLIKVVKTKQWSVGIQLHQLGETAAKTLLAIKQEGGYVVTLDGESAFTADILEMDCFHIGKISEEIAAHVMGVPLHTGYIQYVPAGVRTCLAYPTPVQTGYDFYQALNSRHYLSLCRKCGEEKVLMAIREDARLADSPVVAVLARLAEDESKEKLPLSYQYISGIFSDNMPYNGALALIREQGKKFQWRFAAVSDAQRKKLSDFISSFENQHKVKIQIAWNGGYMLNPELVGKLGLPESYIGAPLGLLISESNMLSPPLFNKPALLIGRDGRLEIKRVNCRGGLKVECRGKVLDLGAAQYNPAQPRSDCVFYDLLHGQEYLYGRGRIVVRLSGNVIKEIVHSAFDADVPVIPVGLVLSFAADHFPPDWQVDDKLTLKMKEFDHVASAVEAGPLLVSNGQLAIDMEAEGWKTDNSIRTQAARLDYVDMRGPKIAAGIDAAGNLAVLTINGRIRESVGATHEDMARILIEHKIVNALGFDPGGSSTLFACQKIINISPYNSDYEADVLSLPPQPRPVGSAVLGWISG